jgi:hypothetical protein
MHASTLTGQSGQQPSQTDANGQSRQFDQSRRLHQGQEPGIQTANIGHPLILKKI